MKKATLTIGLFTLVMVLTSFTTPEIFNYQQLLTTLQTYLSMEWRSKIRR